MKRSAIFFDRDNTLIVNDGYLGDPSRVVLVPGAARAIAEARDRGFCIVTVSNQSGVARGMFDEAAVGSVNRRMDEMLQAQDSCAIVDRHEYCPYHPEATLDAYRQTSDLRKPMPGMILSAARALDLDLSTSWVIGDSLRDVETGIAAGCRTVWVTDPSFPPSPDAAVGDVKPDFQASSLTEAMHFIQRSTKSARILSMTGDQTPQEHLLSEILQELRSARSATQNEFSVTRLLAGIMQVLALAVALLGYFDREPTSVTTWLLAAIFLQMLTVALLLMGRRIG